MQEWTKGTVDGGAIVYAEGVIGDPPHAISYPVLLDDDGGARVQVGNAFLLWYKDIPDPQKQHIKFAQKWLTASANIERKRRGLPILPEGLFNSFMTVRVAGKQSRRAYGKAAISSGRDLSKRADHLPSFDEMQRMLHRCYAGDAAIHPNPLRALQTGVEVRITHATGVRGQLVRSAKFAHLSPRAHPELADNHGINSTVMCVHTCGQTM
jgi:hypothetical protein